MPKPHDKFGYWPQGAAYVTPPKPPVMAPICQACGSRHSGATINCDLTNDTPEEPEDGFAAD